MFDDELEPQKQMPTVKNLEPLSLDELGHYIEEMRTEIIRTEKEIERKKASMNAAASVFK